MIVTANLLTLPPSGYIDHSDVQPQVPDVTLSGYSLLCTEPGRSHATTSSGDSSPSNYTKPDSQSDRRRSLHFALMPRTPQVTHKDDLYSLTNCTLTQPGSQQLLMHMTSLAELPLFIT